MSSKDTEMEEFMAKISIQYLSALYAPSIIMSGNIGMELIFVGDQDATYLSLTNALKVDINSEILPTIYGGYPKLIKTC